jgi:hypothetical protein
MFSFLLLAFLFAFDDPKQDQTEDKRPVVELWFEKEHVPDKLQPGEKVHIKMVIAATINGKGERQYRLRDFVREVEVAEVNIKDNPKEPWEAVFVKFRVTPEQAVQMKKIRSAVISVQDSQTKKTTKRPVPLHVERVKSDGK